MLAEQSTIWTQVTQLPICNTYLATRIDLGVGLLRHNKHWYAVGGEEAFSKQPISSLLLQCGHILREQLSHLMDAEGSRESLLLAFKPKYEIDFFKMLCYTTTGFLQYGSHALGFCIHVVISSGGRIGF